MRWMATASGDKLDKKQGLYAKLMAKCNRYHAQSAMEYLMTYGWSILIIAIVLAALYQLGVFSGIAANGNSCVSQSGFLCSGGSLNTAGALSITLGYSGSGALNISAIGCSNSTAPPTTAWSLISANTTPLRSKQTTRVMASCNLNGMSKIGTPFSGTIWVQYWTGSYTATQEIGAVEYTASSVASSPTSVAATVYGISNPYCVAYNPSNGYMYVANYGGPTVRVISGNSILSTITVGAQPTGVAYNPSNGYMYVATYIGNSVSVISGTSVISTITGEYNPIGVAYNPSNGYIYVANNGGSTVSVISGTTIVNTITVGTNPWGVAYNPSNGYMYVTNMLSGSVSVISGNSVVNTIAIGSLNPFGIAYNPRNGYMYTANNDGTVSVISGNSVLTSITIGTWLRGITYNPSNGYMYVATYGSNTINLISGTSLVGSPITVGPYPIYAAYNPVNGYMYVSNWGGTTVSIV